MVRTACFQKPGLLSGDVDMETTSGCEAWVGGDSGVSQRQKNGSEIWDREDSRLAMEEFAHKH
jgi:hypothetical protein